MIEAGLLLCDFCDKSDMQVRWLFKQGASHICDECVDLCGKIMAELEAGEIEYDSWLAARPVGSLLKSAGKPKGKK